MHKKLSKTVAIALATSILSGMCSIGTVNAEADSDPIKIMSVGDSITNGYWEQGAYRKYMYNVLASDGYSIDMVGSSGSNEESFSDENGNTFAYDGNHVGYSGYAIQYITGTETRQGILEVLTEKAYGDGGNQNMIEAYNPDIVLLQIGTNDVLSAYNDGIKDRLRNLAETILSDMTDETDVLFITTIPYFDAKEVYSWLWAYGSSIPEYYEGSTDPEKQQQVIDKINGFVDTYNQDIKELVSEMQTEGENVQFADINSVVDIATDMYDGVHPNEAGYKKMGEYWAERLEEYWGKEPDVTTTTTTEETIATEETSTTTEETTTEVTTTTTEEITTTEETTTTEVTTTTTEETSATEITTTTEETTTTEPEIVVDTPGDCNNDGMVNIIDMAIMKNGIVYGFKNEITEKRADMNQDGKTNIADLFTIAKFIIGM